MITINEFHNVVVARAQPSVSYSIYDLDLSTVCLPILNTNTIDQCL